MPAAVRKETMPGDSGLPNTLSNALLRVLRPENLILIALIAVWFGTDSSTPDYLFPPPARVLYAMWDLVSQPSRVHHTLITLQHIFLSLTLGMVAGLLLASVAHYWALSRRMVYLRFTPFLNSFPALGWIFLAVIWFGLNDTTVIFAITVILIPFAVINIREGFIFLDAELVEMSSSFTKNGLRKYFYIVIPLLYPYIFGALRICFGVAWKVALTTEMFGGNAGFGVLMNRARTSYQIDLVIAIILLIIAFVYIGDRFVFEPMQRRVQAQFGGK